MAEPSYVSVLCAHLACRRGLGELAARPNRHVIECATLAQLRASARRHALSAIVIDLDHLDQGCATLLAAARALLPGRVIPIGSARRQAATLTALDDAGLADAGLETASLMRGSFAHLGRPRRPSAGLAREVRTWEHVTPRQRSVLGWLALGRDNRTIAKALGIGERAVKAHVSGLLARFGLDNRTELALLAADAGLGEPASR